MLKDSTVEVTKFLLSVSQQSTSMETRDYIPVFEEKLFWSILLLKSNILQQSAEKLEKYIYNCVSFSKRSKSFNTISNFT